MLSNDEVICLLKGDKHTIIKAYIEYYDESVFFDNCHSFMDNHIIIGEYHIINNIIMNNLEMIKDYYYECDGINVPLKYPTYFNRKVRIEKGAIIREYVELGDNVVVMMGAIINVNVKIEDNTMIDMNAVIGAGVKIGSYCHIGAGCVIAGNLEPPSSKGVIIDDHVLIGANAVILEGIHIGKNVIVGAGSIVTHDIEDNCVVVGNPAHLIKNIVDVDKEKYAIIEEIRKI